MVANPFKPATPVAKKLKLLFYGPSGSGKTIAALTFPKVALVDSEGGSDLYAGRPGIAPFHILRTKTIAQLDTALNFIREDNGQTFETLVIDPITVFYDVLKNAVSSTLPNGKDMTFRDWNKVNSKMKALYNQLTMLPVHVVVIAREAIEYEGEGNSLKKVGVKPDVDKAAVYLFDFVVHMAQDHSGVIEKTRGIALGSERGLKRVEWSAFEKAANAFIEGTAAISEDEEEAVQDEARRQQVGDAKPPANGNGHQQEPPDEQPPAHWLDARRTVFETTLMKHFELSISEAEKLLYKPMREFASGQDAVNAIRAKLDEQAKQQPPAKPKNGKPAESPWWQKEMQSLSIWLDENFDETPNRILPMIGAADWKAFATREEAEEKIKEVAAKQCWSVTAKQASYVKGSGGKMFIQLHTILAKLPWYSRNRLVEAVADTATVDWSEVTSWTEGMHDLPEPIRVATKHDGEHLAVASIHSAVGIPF